MIDEILDSTTKHLFSFCFGCLISESTLIRNSKIDSRKPTIEVLRSPSQKHNITVKGSPRVFLDLRIPENTFYDDTTIHSSKSNGSEMSEMLCAFSLRSERSSNSNRSAITSLSRRTPSQSKRIKMF